jgi:hypothetical protein
MKNMIFALIASVSISASAAQYVTVEVCDGGESGTICRTVTYKVRPASAPEVVACTVPAGEAGEAGEQPCPKVTGVPSWLKKLNQAFLDAGFTTPVIDESLVGGP